MSETATAHLGLILYGITNCDSVKKARQWLLDHRIKYVFHDFKKMGASESLLQSWVELVGWEQLINRKGSTWRALPDQRKVDLGTNVEAIRLMQESPSLIKRPVLQSTRFLQIGFKADQYLSLLGTSGQ
jgi:arsenate reductase